MLLLLLESTRTIAHMTDFWDAQHGTFHTGPGADPASYTIRTVSLFRGKAAETWR
jgi:hypothetical protein